MIISMLLLLLLTPLWNQALAGWLSRYGCASDFPMCAGQVLCMAIVLNDSLGIRNSRLCLLGRARPPPQIWPRRARAPSSSLAHACAAAQLALVAQPEAQAEQRQQKERRKVNLLSTELIGSPLTVGVPMCLEEGPLAATQPIEKFFSNHMFGVQTVSSLRETHQLTEFEWIRMDLKGFAGQTGQPA